SAWCHPAPLGGPRGAVAIRGTGPPATDDARLLHDADQADALQGGCSTLMFGGGCRRAFGGCQMSLRVPIYILQAMTLVFLLCGVIQFFVARGNDLLVALSLAFIALGVLGQGVVFAVSRLAARIERLERSQGSGNRE